AAVDDLVRADNETRARGECRQPLAETLRQRCTQFRGVQQLVDRRRLTAGKNDRVDAGEMLRPLDERGLGAERGQRFGVFTKRALQGEDADFHVPTPSPLRSGLRRVRAGSFPTMPMAWRPHKITSP